MRLGVLIPTRGAVMQSAHRPPVEECWTMARHADGAGYDAVWVGDSIVAKPRLEPLTTLGYLAGITSRVRLGTAVLLPALRHPVVLAHQIANVDQISRGRVVLGLGVGWSLPSAEREWAACGADHKRRVRRLEEHVELWRMLWRGEPVTYKNGDVELSDHTIGPLPWNPAGPPVLITAANRGEMLAAQFDASAGSATGSSRRTSTRRSAGSSASAPRKPWPATAAPRRPSSSAYTPLCGWMTIRAPPSASPRSSWRHTTAAAST